MSKILLISNRLIIGGPSVHLKHLIQYFDTKHEIMLAYGEAQNDEASLEDEFREFNIITKKVRFLRRSTNPINDIRFFREIETLIKDFKPDIVHTHTSKPGIVARYAAYRLKVPKIIHTYHGLVFETYFSGLLSSILVKIDRFLAKNTDYIIALSERQKKEIVNVYGIGDENIVRVIPLAISFNIEDFSEKLATSYRKKWKISTDTILIAQVGRLAEVKDNSLMIDAFSSLLKRTNKKTVLFIVGGGDLKYTLVEQAQSLHLKVSIGEATNGADVIFTSWCDNLKKLYSAMDLLVLTSKSEGTPFSIIEAQMSGTAVLAPNIGGISDMIIDDITGALFNNIADFESKLLSMVDNKEQLNEFGIKAGKLAKEKFNMNKMLSSYEELYKI